MNRTSSCTALLLVVVVACGGTELSSSKDGASATETATSPGSPAPANVPAPAAATPPAAPAAASDNAPGAASQSCSTSQKVLNDHSEFDQRCTTNGQTTSRDCTLATGDAAWSCSCTAASGKVTSCQAALEDPSVITTPANCCPAE